MESRFPCQVHQASIDVAEMHPNLMIVRLMALGGFCFEAGADKNEGGDPKK